MSESSAELCSIGTGAVGENPEGEHMEKQAALTTD
jgi:hypothetical protein